MQDGKFEADNLINSCLRKSAVASPSNVESRAMTTSLTCRVVKRSFNLFIDKCSGPLRSKGERTPPSTW